MQTTRSMMQSRVCYIHFKRIGEEWERNKHWQHQLNFFQISMENISQMKPVFCDTIVTSRPKELYVQPLDEG